MSKRSPINDAARSTLRAKESFDRFVMKVALVVGWAGVAALCALAPMWYWGGRDEKLGAWMIGAVMAASLVGWGYINEGQNELSRRMGGALGMIVFFWLPLACGAATLLEARLAHWTGFAPPDHPFWLFVRWYPPVMVMWCAATYLKRQALPRARLHFWRGVGSIVLLLPYAILFAYLVLHLRVEPLEGPLHETLGEVGRYSIIVQLLLMYFVGGAAT
ncbi:hypothetical protein PLCT1_02343 [Planctomycetaceae bacterium]|nr:hypothetical protein PLCT1_02343 [Planctomycetaceae bacterium]